MNLQLLTATDIKEFEKYACDNFDITIDEMMQNAGRAVFDVVINEVGPKSVLVVAGRGNNGGDALVTARLLKEKGVDVTIFQIENSKSQKNPEKIFEALLVNPRFDLIIDGIFGFSLKGDPQFPADKIIEQINCSSLGFARDDKFIPVLAIDVPSGMDAETGQIMNPTVRAEYTVTLGMPKIGLDKHKDHVGKLYLGNVGIPDKAYEKLGICTTIFSGRSYISLN